MAKEKDLISIVVPIYNKEEVLSFCIEGIINQTYKYIEVILVNDGSEDSSLELCYKYEKIDSRIKVINQENKGLSEARNSGIQEAIGKYISFIDADDVIAEEYIEYLYNSITEHNADISQCSVLRIPVEDISKVEDIIRNHNNKLSEEVIMDLSNIEALNMLYSLNFDLYVSCVVVINKLYKIELFNDIKFTSGKLHEDEHITYRLFYKAKKISLSNKVLYGYVQTENSLMRSSISQKRIDDILNAYKECAGFFRKENIERLEAKCRRRYLEYCIELAKKVIKDKVEDIEYKLSHLRKEYNEKYDKYIKFIEENAVSIEERELIKSLKEYREKG